MPFHPAEMLVFDRTGARVGTITKWSITVPRSYRLNEVEDMTFIVPLADVDGSPIYDTAMADLLIEDNIVYVENELTGLPAWAGPIITPAEGNDQAEFACLSGLSLLNSLESARITQSGGTSSVIASRLVSAAQAKQAAHGDIVVGFVADGTTPNFGTYTYEGDVLVGLQQLAADTLAEFYMEPILAPDGSSLSFKLHWSNRFAVTTGLTLSDGPGGAIKPGTRLQRSGLEVVNHARLRGTPTHLADFLDYDCIKGVVTDISPEASVTLDDNPTQRRKEDLALTVAFGLSDEAQKAIATQIQDTYLGYYKSFLYAYHNRQGRPFLPGFDWSGPDGVIDKKITERYYRTWQKLGRIGQATVVTSETDNSNPNAVIDDWQLDVTIDPLGAGTCAGIALDWGSLTDHWLADSSNGHLYLLDSDNVTLTDWGMVTASGETLRSVATDPAQMNSIWVLVTTGSEARVRSYDIDSNDLLTAWSIAFPQANDIQVDYVNGLLYVVGNDGVGQVQVRDINNGSLLSPDTSFASGFTNPVGLSLSGGVVYVANTAGQIRMLFANDGSLAGTFSTGLAANGMYVDLQNRRIWMALSNGTIAIYHAYVALAAISAPGSVDGAPGFDNLLSGQFVHILMSNDHALAPSTQHTKTDTTYVVKSGPGSLSPDGHDNLWVIALHFYGNGSSWPTIYYANRSIIGANPSLIFPGQVLRIPGVNAVATPPTTPPVTKYLIAWQTGHWRQASIPGPVGQPDQIQREWLLDGDQHVGFTTAAKCKIQDPKVVIVGEEGRVCDWDPGRDGYGVYKETQRYKTRTGHYITAGPGWYPQNWDVPDRAFQAEPDTPWPEGKDYLTAYLARHNRSIQTFTFTTTNLGNAWDKIERGALITAAFTLQGPRPSGRTIACRVLAFSPSEASGEMDIVAEPA